MNKKVNKNKNSSDKKYLVNYRFVVDKEMPLLDFLIEKLTKLSRNNVKTILSSKCVLVDGVSVSRHDYLLSKKSIVEITKSPVIKNKENESIKLDIIYEDDEFLVINKPSNLLSISDEKETNNTAFSYCLNYVRKTNPKNQIFVTHRIDKDTSGVLMFSKNINIRNLLQDKWNDIVTNREYIALVEGTFINKSGTIKSYLTETKTHIVFSSKGKNGKLAITNYTVLKENKNYSLLKVNIDSGRKNQIRVHLSENNHPIVGDEKYGNKISPINRLGLHANKLEFIHPINKKKYTFEAKTPSIFYSIFK